MTTEAECVEALREAARELGESHPVALDSHHAGEKTTDISRRMNHGFSRESIPEEMEARIVICANYHRKGHYDVPDEPPG